MDSLQEISIERWVDIQQEFLKDWPRGISGYYLLETQRKYKEIGADYGFKVYCPYGRIGCGIVALNVKNTLYEVIMQCPIVDTSVLESSLLTTNVIDWSKKICVPYAPEHIVNLVKNIVQKLNIEIEWQTTCSKYVIFKDDPCFENITLPDDVKFGPLKQEHVEFVDSVWPHKFIGSDWIFKKLIEANGGFGLFKNNKLISWVFIAEYGKLTHMYTIEEERNKGYGEKLLRKMTNHLLGEGKDVLACCVEGNRAYTLYEKNRFHKTQSATWIGLKPKDEKL